MSPARWGYPGRVVAITAAALAGRLVLLGHTALWRDEAFTGVVARRPLPDLLDAVRADTNPPLSYLLTHLVTPVSSGPAALRFMPALAGTGAVPIAAALARRVDGDRAGVIAAATVALMPAFVVSSRDARMYALATTLGMALVLAVWRASERPDRGRLALVAGCTSALVYTHYLGLIAVVGVAAGVGLCLRPPPAVQLRLAAAVGGGVASLAPWLVVAPHQAANAPTWIRALNHDQLLGVLTEFFCGPGVDPGTPGRDALQILQAGAICGGGVAGLCLLAGLVRMGSRPRRGVAFLGVSGLGAVIVLLALSTVRPLFEARYASVLWGPLAPLIGVGLARLRPGPLRGLALGSMATVAAALAFFLTRADVPALTARADARLGAGDVLLAPPDQYLLVLYYAAPATVQRARVLGADLPAFWGTAAYPPGAQTAAPPDPPGRLAVIRASSSNPLAVATDLHLAERDCVTLVCLDLYAH